MLPQIESLETTNTELREKLESTERELQKAKQKLTDQAVRSMDLQKTLKKLHEQLGVLR